jgi:hypothetical protein
MRGKRRETSFVSPTFVAHKLFALSWRPRSPPLWTGHDLGKPDGKCNRAGPNLNLGEGEGRLGGIFGAGTPKQL